MPTIDVHQHLWPEPLIEALAGRQRPPRLSGSMLELPGAPAVEVDLAAHRLETRLALLDRCGIDVAVVSLQPTLGFGALPDAEWAELANAYERGIRELAAASERIVPLAADVSSEDFVGACVGAPALLDLDVLGPKLDELERRGAFLFVHPGPGSPPRDVPAWWPAVVEHTAQMHAAYAAWLDRGVERWPRLEIVFAILAGGGPFQLERLQSRGISGRDSLHETLYFETASYGRRALELCLSTLGVGRVVFGSSAPTLDPEPALDAIRGFGDAVVDTLCDQNPSRLLA
jgi:predicted TIM-barrel fold metal-dependent hydrolase